MPKKRRKVPKDKKSGVPKKYCSYECQTKYRKFKDRR